MTLSDKYKTIPLPVKASIWYVICDVIQKGLLILTIPIFTRIMTTAEFGLTNVYSSWMAIITIFATLNLQHGTFNAAMVEFEGDRDRFIASMQGLVTTNVIIIFAIYYLLHPFIDAATSLSMPLFIAMALQMASTTIFGFWSGKKRFDYRYREIVIATLVSAVLSTAISIILVFYASANKGEIKIIATVAIQAIVFAPIYFLNFKKGGSFFNKQYWIFALRMNIPLIPYYLAQAVFNNSDLLMIDWICGMDDAALYGTAFSLGTIVSFVIAAINNSFVPWKYQRLKCEKYEHISGTTSSIAALISGILMVFMLLGPEVMRLLAAPNYFDARWVIPPVAASMFFLFYVQQFVDIEFLLRNRLMLIAGSACAAIANVVLNALLIPLFGYIAAAFTTLISYILFVACNYATTKRAIRVANASYTIADLCNVKSLSLMGIGLIGFSILCYLLYLNDYIRYATIAFLALILVAMRKRIMLVLKMFI